MHLTAQKLFIARNVIWKMSIDHCHSGLPIIFREDICSQWSVVSGQWSVVSGQ